MLANSPVVQSRAARLLFLITASITACIVFWIQYFTPSGVGLTAIFFRLFVTFDAESARWMLAILLGAVFIAAVLPANALLEWIAEHLFVVATLCGALLCVGALTIYLNHPLSMDEYAAFLQSQIFAAGQVSGHWPISIMDWVLPRDFQNFFISVSKSSGEIASAYWPSFSLLLAPFTALHVPWACNPTISALTLIAAYRLSMAVHPDRKAAALVVLFIICSPEFLINGISYYSMPAHLLANTVYALLLVAPTRAKAAAAGVVGSIALTLHNPFPHLLFSLPWFLWVVRRPDGARMSMCLMAGYVPLCLLLAVGWLTFTGHLRYAGLAATSGKDLGRMLPLLSVFSLPDPVLLLARLIGLAKVWIWTVPGLFVLAAAGAWNGRSNRALLVLTSSALVTLFGYFLVPVDQGHGWGGRYFHSAWVVLPLLAAYALTNAKSDGKPGLFQDERARALAVASAVLMLVVGCTVSAIQVRGFMSAQLAQQPSYTGAGRHVLLLDPSFSYYGMDLVQNDPWLRGDVIRLLSHGRLEDARMMATEFPGSQEVGRDLHGSVWSIPPQDMQTGYLP